MSGKISPWWAIFDLDGVLVDSSAAHKESWEILAQREGLPLSDDHFERSFGMRNEQIIPELFGWTDDPAEIRRLADLKEAIFREQIREQGIEPLPGVVTLLQTLQSHGIPAAIGTSTPAANLECILEITGLAPYFAARVCSEDVTRGKPDPEVFLQAARRLGADPARCVVFEDAPVGITAAKAAGMHCIAVATTREPEQLRQADLVLPDLTAFPLEAVKDPFACFTAEVSG